MKIDRLLAITILLLNREKVTARELSERFEVSVRTIYRDIDALNLAGIPVTASQGSGGGIFLMPGYRVDHQFFTSEEILSLITTLSGITSILGDAGIRGAEEKIRHLSGLQPADSGGREGPVSIDLSGWERIPGLKEKLTRLVRAIQDEKLVRFTYTNLEGGTVARETEPLKVFFEFSNWYLLAWCRLRKDYRYFRISRMDDLAVLDRSFDRPARMNDSGRGAWQEKTPVEIELLFSDTSDGRIRDFFSREDIRVEEDGLHVTARWPLDEWVYGYILGLGPRVEVLSPPAVREEIVRRIRDMERLYGPET